MSDSKKISLQHYDDGMPSVLRKPTVYTELFFYRKSDVLLQLTKTFCTRFLPRYGDRTVDQMVQAARSTKQNITEGLSDGQTSFEVELKLLGISKGSNQELLEDYQDYLKHHHLCDWAKASESTIQLRYNKLLSFCRIHNDLADYEPYFNKWTDEELCNTAITLCHIVDKSLTTFIAKRDREFVEEGGIRERMTAARLEQRSNQKQQIAILQAENTHLKAQLESLKRKIAALKSADQ